MKTFFDRSKNAYNNDKKKDEKYCVINIYIVYYEKFTLLDFFLSVILVIRCNKLCTLSSTKKNYKKITSG